MQDITTIVTSEVAEALIRMSGAERVSEYHRWVFPDEFETWLTEEALTHALPFIAENADVV